VRSASPAVVVVVGAAAVAGCIASERIAPTDLDRWTALAYVPSALGPVVSPEVAGRRLPGRWVFRRHPSVLWSAESLVRAADRLRAGEAEEVEVLLSPKHARSAADLLARGRGVLLQMRDACDLDRAGGPGSRRVDAERWADGMARALAGLEGVVRAVVPDPASTRRGEEPLGVSAGPILEMVLGYLDQRAGGAVLGDLGPEEAGRVRSVLVQTALAVGFAAAGRRVPEGLRQGVETALGEAAEPEEAVPRLREMLAEAVRRAPPAPGGTGALAGPVRSVLVYAPKALEALERLARQWDRMEAVTVELRRGPVGLAAEGEGAGGEASEAETVVAVTLAVRDGREVRLENLVMFQPVLAVRGRCRLVVMPDHPPTGETVVAFEPLPPRPGPEARAGGEMVGPAGGGGALDTVAGGRGVGEGGGGDQRAARPETGAVELRFEGLVWGLAKLLVLPLADGRLREVRVFTGGNAEGGRADRILNVALVMEAKGAKGDPRRLLLFQDVRRRRIERGPFAIRTVAERTEQVFHYLTPEKRYTFKRVKSPAG